MPTKDGLARLQEDCRDRQELTTKRGDAPRQSDERLSAWSDKARLVHDGQRPLSGQTASVPNVFPELFGGDKSGQRKLVGVASP